MKLLKELKRRNVIRVGAAYVVIGWLLLQVADTLTPALHLPEWIMSGIALVLILGIIPTLLFSWAYELTPDGIKKDSEVDQTNSGTSQTAKKLDVITLVAVIAIAVLIAWQQMNPRALTPSSAKKADQTSNLESITSGGVESNQPASASIAVLPFADLSPDKNQSHFSDGIAEEILNVLVRIESLDVASRTSAFGFKGQEALGIPAIAEKLKVRHVLEGSVRKSGDQVRITAQLIDAKTDIHLWSDTYDRQLTTENIFAVQDEIAGVIVQQLGIMIGDEPISEPHREATTDSVDAYEIFLKAQGLYHVRSGDNLMQIMSLYEQAVSIDPNFAEAWAGLAATYLVIPDWRLGTEEEYYPKTSNAADRATELNDQLALPYVSRGGILSESGDMIGAIEQMDTAAQLAPKNIQTAYFRGGILLELGYLEQSEKFMRHCLKLDPSYGICQRILSISLFYQGQNELAARLFEEGLLKGQASYYEVLANYYGAVGDKRALALLIAIMYPNELPARELEFKYQTDDAYSLSSYNYDLLRSSSLDSVLPKDLEEKLGLEEIARSFYTADFLWSPYNPILRRPDTLDEYSAVRKKLMKEIGAFDYWHKHGPPPQCKAVGDDDFECN
ncbi:MAG: adenylate cyclase [Polaribacter sp.]|jgi:adenylate cyclase